MQILLSRPVRTMAGRRTVRSPASRALLAACLTHALHDGYTDGLYALLPVWQPQFGLSYAALAGLRALYYATMGGLQIPADRALGGLSPRLVLTMSSVIASTGLLLAAVAATLVPSATGQGKGGFGMPAVIGVRDTATRLGFLPFLVHARGGAAGAVGLCFALVFVGGAFGKASCARLADTLSVVGSMAATEALTALLIVVILFTPLSVTLVLLPLLGIVLNGTSSVLYGSVPELARGDTGQTFVIFYTGVIGSSGLAPILFGALADHSSRSASVLAAAATAALIVPLAMLLRPFLADQAPLPPGQDGSAEA